METYSNKGRVLLAIRQEWVCSACTSNAIAAISNLDLSPTLKASWSISKPLVEGVVGVTGLQVGGDSAASIYQEAEATNERFAKNCARICSKRMSRNILTREWTYIHYIHALWNSHLLVCQSCQTARPSVDLKSA